MHVGLSTDRNKITAQTVPPGMVGHKSSVLPAKTVGGNLAVSSYTRNVKVSPPVLHTVYF